jgi:hypothetical protein
VLGLNVSDGFCLVVLWCRLVGVSVGGCVLVSWRKFINPYYINFCANKFKKPLYNKTLHDTPIRENCQVVTQIADFPESTTTQKRLFLLFNNQ